MKQYLNDSDSDLQNMKSTQGSCSSCGATSSRRNFAKGAFAAPILASMISQPAWGVACSISGLRSTNLSGIDHDTCYGNGCTPGFWSQNLDAWKVLPGIEPGICGDLLSNGKCKQWNTTIGATTFSSIFPCAFPLSFPPNPDPTLIEIMLNHNLWGSEGTFFFHIIAAYFNAVANSALYGATPQQVLDLYALLYCGAPNPQGLTYLHVLPVLDKMNNAGTCFLNAFGEYTLVEELHVLDPVDKKSIPACPDGYKWNSGQNQCILK